MTTGSMLHPMLPLRATAVDGAGLARTRSGRVGLTIVLLMSALAVAAPWIAPCGPLDLAGPSLQPPSLAASDGHRQRRPRPAVGRALRQPRFACHRPVAPR